MTVTFFSNYLVHHQTPLCEALRKRLGEGFRFVETEPLPEERLEMGYRNLSDAPYVLNACLDEASMKEAMKLGEESDVVIIGSAPDIFIERRLEQNKITFRYCERYFKKLRWRFDPRAWRMHYQKDIRYRKKNLFMLCASAYTAPDCRFLFSYPNKTFKWGYFPDAIRLSFDQLQEKKATNEKPKLLWVSRFIKLKHPEEALDMAKKLKNAGIDFELEMIGVGELRDEVKTRCRKEGLNDVVSFSGPFSPEEVLEKMQQADIFLFTSDRNEGWGAVMNEAMSSGCATIACREIGSVPYLIEDGLTGLVYEKRKKDSLFFCAKRLIEDRALRETIRKNAYRSMKEVWNADVACERLLHLIDCIKRGEETGYTSGPCSRD